jgi:hypothetical protein
MSAWLISSSPRYLLCVAINSGRAPSLTWSVRQLIGLVNPRTYGAAEKSQAASRPAQAAPQAILHVLRSCASSSAFSFLAFLRKVHASSHIPAVSFCPAAHSSEWGDDCPSQSGQGILDSNGLRTRHALGDEPYGFEIAKRSGKHALRDASEMSAQLPVSMRLLFERKQYPGCPPADKDRRGTVRSLHCLHSVLPREKAQLGTCLYLCS